MAACAYDCLQGDLWASGNQQIWLSTQQFSRADKWAARILDGAIVNDNVLPLAEPILFQLRRKGLVDSRGRSCAVRPEKSYSGDFFNLLRASPKWPRQRRATHKYDEFAPPHLPPRGSDSKIVATFTLIQEGGRCPLWVKSRHVQCKRPCPLYPRKQTYAVH